MLSQWVSPLAAWLRALLRALCWLRVGWRWVAGLAVAGALAGALLALPSLGRWSSEAEMALTPRLLLEGYLLTTSELAPHYAQRLQAPARLAAAQAALALPRAPQVDAWAEPGRPLLRLRVTATQPRAAEQVARWLLNDLQGEIARENRQRPEGDRLAVAVAPAAFARPLRPPWRRLLGGGAALGAALGAAIAVGRGSHAARRLAAPLEAEQLLGAPTLGAIPRRSLRRG